MLGNINVLRATACALFDSSASQSFARTCSLQTKLLPYKLVVMIPGENVIACARVVKDCPVEIKDRALKANLMVFYLMVQALC